jgi:purine-binding chemotaxis protein CheW
VSPRRAKDAAAGAEAEMRPARRQRARSAEPVTVLEQASSASPDEPSPPDVLVAPERLVVFLVESQRYALPIEVVQEIQQIVALSEIPDDSGSVVGVINLRGAVVPAMDIRRLLGLPSRDYGLQTPMVFTRTPRGLVALIVDEVADVVEVPQGCMQQASAGYDLADKLLGVCHLDESLVFVFDIERLVPSSRKVGGERASR